MSDTSEMRTLQPRSKLGHWWDTWVAGGVDHDAVLREIAEDSGWSGRYAFLIVISTALSLLGLLMPSVAVLIGAMLLSPLMMPIIGLGFGIATFDTQEIRRAAMALVAGSAIAVVLSVVFVAISPIQTITSEIASRTRPTLFDLLVALLSAVAGAYALMRGRGGAVVGVAIAIALMPPLAVVGFGIATRNWTVFSGSLLLFLTNAIVIALTAALVARAYGFGSDLTRQHTWWQLVLFVGALGLLSLPLGAGLRQIAFESLAQRQVRDAIAGHFPDASRLGQLDIDYSAEPIRVRAVVVTPEVHQRADQVLTADLAGRWGRPVDLHVDQLLAAPAVGGVEAAQLARASGVAATGEAIGVGRAAADLALIAGVDPAAVRVDLPSRGLIAEAAVMPGLEAAGYRALEQRARQALPGWNVAIVPPADLALPPLDVVEGVVDDGALSTAAWASARLGRTLRVEGGTSGQRQAIATSIGGRGGVAEPGTGGGPLRISWSAVSQSE